MPKHFYLKIEVSSCYNSHNMKKEKNSWLRRFFAGIGIGTGAAIPGVSGAAVALIFRVYESIINAVNGFTKHIKKSISTLLPILLGVFIAVIACVIIFDWAFEHCMFLLICLFTGFLLGSFPSVSNEVKCVPLKAKNIIIAVIGGIIVLVLGIISIILGNKGFSFASYFVDSSSFFGNWWIIIVLFFVGILASVALTIPGFSGSLILLILGFYRPLIDSASSWGKEIFKGDFANTGALIVMVLVFGIGCLVGVVFVSKIMTKLLEKHHDETYFAIIGFIIGSFFVLFLNYQIWQYYLVWGGQHIEGINPNMTMSSELVLGIILFGIFAFFSYMLVRAQTNLQNKNSKK